MPSPVNRAAASSAIAALVRQAVAAHSQQRPADKAAGQAESAAKRASKPESKKTKAAEADGSLQQSPLSKLIAARAQSLDPDAHDYRSRLLRLVIEASLLHEFGSHLLNAPKFQTMVDQVLHDLESAPQLKDDVSTVLGTLTIKP